MELSAIVESLIFSSPEAITTDELARTIREVAKEEKEEDLAKTNVTDVAKAIDALIEHYAEQERAFTLTERDSGWRICALPEYADWSRGLFPERKPSRLSPPALETLAIIAYRQPITKANIEAVRGVSVDGVMQKLIDRELVKIVGRADLPGRPLLYGTTGEFLEHFGVRSVDELPNAAELQQVELPTAETEEAPGEEQLAMGAVTGEESGEEDDAPDSTAADDQPDQGDPGSEEAPVEEPAAAEEE